MTAPVQEPANKFSRYEARKRAQGLKEIRLRAPETRARAVKDNLDR